MTVVSTNGRDSSGAGSGNDSSSVGTAISTRRTGAGDVDNVDDDIDGVNRATSLGSAVKSAAATVIAFTEPTAQAAGGFATLKPTFLGCLTAALESMGSCGKGAPPVGGATRSVLCSCRLNLI